MFKVSALVLDRQTPSGHASALVGIINLSPALIYLYSQKADSFEIE